MLICFVFLCFFVVKVYLHFPLHFQRQSPVQPLQRHKTMTRQTHASQSLYLCHFGTSTRASRTTQRTL